MPDSHTATVQDRKLVHSVYFTLKDRSDQARANLVAACDQYLSNHPGCLHYSAGALAEQYERPVNDRDFDVALTVVFESVAAHDTYQVSETHKQFLAEQSENWTQVRVFDALA